MNMKPDRAPLLVASFIAALGAGCASDPPTVGEQMIEQSKGTRELGKQWQDGNQMVIRGERLRAEGQDEIAKSEAKIRDGERLIADGQKMKEEAETVFRLRFPGQSLDTYK